jgi:hypothetical protein
MESGLRVFDELPVEEVLGSPGAGIVAIRRHGR